MIGVAQNHLTARFAKQIDFDAFDRAKRSDWHERRQFNRPVRGLQSAATSGSFFVLTNQGEHGEFVICGLGVVDYVLSRRS